MKDSKSAPVQPVRIGFEAPLLKPYWWRYNDYKKWEEDMAKCKGKGKKKGK